MIVKKTEQEIEVMRESNQIVSDVHHLLVPHVKLTKQTTFAVVAVGILLVGYIFNYLM